MGSVIFIIVFLLTLFIIYKKIDYRNTNIIKMHSSLYKAVIELNNKYKFNEIKDNVLNFYPVVNSKSALDNLNLYDYVANELIANYESYNSLFKKIESNEMLYKEYLNKYKELYRVTSKDNFSKLYNTKIKYDEFVKYEKKVYLQSKLPQPIISISAKCHATYTSPSGRNYCKDYILYFYELKTILNDYEREIDANIVKYSSLYKAVIELNNKYKFNEIKNNVLNFYPVMNSKSALDNLNIYDYVANELIANCEYYNSLFEKIENNEILYNEYLSKYKELYHTTSKENFLKIQDIKIKYDEFVKCEKKVYLHSKLPQPVTSISAQCHATYTSPSGRNHYWKDDIFSFNQLKEMLRDYEKQQQYLLEENERKERIKTERKEKEKRLKEVDKLEAELRKKEEELNRKEQEFLEATKEHIYSKDNINIENKEDLNNNSSSITQQLNQLKQDFENGEITYEEYEKRRKEIL